MSINAQPFNPTFKLIGNLVEDQVLTYDSSENAFVNSTNTGGGAGAGFDAAVNTGTGLGVWSGSAGTTLQFKTLLGGADISITDNGDALVIASTVSETIQTGTNLGTGTGIYDSKDATTHQLKFKSIVAGAGLTLTDDGAGTLTLVNDIAAGTTDADLTLSNLSNVATARTNLDVHSKAESDAKYHKHDDAFVPSVNNTFDIGSSAFKYNDIYAETFQGIAVLADNLTTSGTTGQVLTYNGSSWTAADTSGGTLLGQSDVSNVAPADGQHLVWNTSTSLWTPSAPSTGGGGYSDTDARNSISVSGDLSYNSSTGVISFTQTDTWANITGTPTTLAGYGITDAFDGAYASLTGAPTLPTLVSQLTNDSGFITTDTNTTYTAGANLSLTGTVFANTAPDQTVALTGTGATSITGTYPNFTIASTDTNTDTNTTYTAGSGLTLTGTEFTLTAAHFDGVYASLSGKPTIATDVNQLTDASSLLAHTTAYTNSDADAHLNTGTATANQALVWTGTDYDWVTSTDSDTTYTAGANISINGSNVISSTDTNTDTTYTAGANLSLTGTVFSNTSPDQTVALTGTGATSITGTYPNFTITSTDTNTDTNTTYTAGTNVSISAGNVISSTDTNTTYTNVSEFTNDAGYSTGAHYTDSDVNTHLNTSTATANQVLTWTGTDYDWISSGAHFDGNYSSLVGAPTTVSSFTNDAGYLTAQTDSQTLTLTGTTLAISTGNNVDLGALTIDDFADVNITSVSDGQFLKYDNASGDWLNETVTIYTDSDVDTHLNTGSATTSQILSWTGTDYDWIAKPDYADSDVLSLINFNSTLSVNKVLMYSGGQFVWVDNGPYSINANIDVTISGTDGGQFLVYNINTADWENQHVNISDLYNVSSTAPSSGQVLKWSGTEWAPAADTDTDTVYTTFTTDFDTRLAAKSTTDVSEGSNKYFTDARARQAISATGDITYNSTTGVISYTASAHYANSDVDLHLNKGGSVTSGYILSWNGSDYNWIANSGTPAWSAITGKPTTIAGFGITDSFFDGAFGSLTSKPTTLSGYGITDATDTDTTYTAGTGLTLTGTVFSNTSPDQTVALTGSGATTITGTYPNFTIASTDTNTDTNTTYTAGSGLTLTGTAFSLTDAHFSGVYADLTSKPTIPSVLTDLSISDGTTGQVLTTNGSGAFTFTTVSGGGSATDKIEEGNSSVEVIDGGADGRIMFNTNGTDRWQVDNGGHILPEANATYDIGSASNKVRHLFLSGNSLHLDTNTIKTSGTNLLFNDDDVMDYDNLKNKPTIPEQNTAGTGIQVNSGVVSISASLDLLSNVSAPAPATGEVLKWNGSAWAPATDLTSGSSAMNDLSDVSTAGITSGQYLQWNGSSFVASTVSSGGASAINDLSDVDTTTSAPSNGDVLTWVQADSEWAPATPAAGGGSGATIEMFKVNYNTSGNLDTITNTSSGVSATITSATGGTVDITFSSTSYPPANMLMYGYAYTSNKYVVKPVSGDMTTKEVTGGGSSGSPIAFGTMGSVKLTLKLREADTGASRSFGTTTHAWLMFTTI